MRRGAMQSAKPAMAAVIAALAGLPASRPVAANELYPVWWSPVLELESLHDIDERLARKFKYPFTAYKGRGAERKSAHVDNCNSLKHWWAQGYADAVSSDRLISLYDLVGCRIIELLRRAKPARTSFVRTFMLDTEAVNYLPAMVDLEPFTSRVKWQCEANEKGIPLARASNVSKLKVIGPNEMKFESPGMSVGVELMARGDFNGDGLDDLVVRVRVRATGGTWGATRHFLLSRATSQAVLRILNTAEIRACRT